MPAGRNAKQRVERFGKGAFRQQSARGGSLVGKRRFRAEAMNRSETLAGRAPASKDAEREVGEGTLKEKRAKGG
jgi:hypothetical protein